MTFVWKDETSFSRGETDRTPRVWTMYIGRLRLVVHRIHRLDGWYASCDPFFKDVPLDPQDAEDAKQVAIRVLVECTKPLVEFANAAGLV